MSSDKSGNKLDKFQVIERLVQLRFEIETCRNLSTGETTAPAGRSPPRTHANLPKR